MEKVTKARFSRQIGKYQEKAMLGEPIIITAGRDQKPKTVLLSYELFEQLATKNRRVVKTEHLDSDILNEILNGEMNSIHNKLESLIS